MLLQWFGVFFQQKGNKSHISNIIAIVIVLSRDLEIFENTFKGLLYKNAYANSLQINFQHSEILDNSYTAVTLQTSAGFSIEFSKCLRVCS